MWGHGRGGDGGQVGDRRHHHRQEDTMYRNQIRSAVLAGGLLVTTLVMTSPATASPDPGDPVRTDRATMTLLTCELQRVGTQLVRCDDLTGAGATAPTYVPERS
jgi:hypothetical protein